MKKRFNILEVAFIVVGGSVLAAFLSDYQNKGEIYQLFHGQPVATMVEVVEEEPPNLTDEKLTFLLQETDMQSTELSQLSARTIEIWAMAVENRKYISELEARIIALEE